MYEVKISVCGVEMTPDQAKKVYHELGKLFNPTPSVLGLGLPTKKPADRYPPISVWPPEAPVFGPNPAVGFIDAQKSPG